jgi:hypothetical protein
MTQLFPDPCSPDPNPCPAQADDGIRWRLHAKRVGPRGRSDVTGRTARRWRSRRNPPDTHPLIVRSMMR